MGNSEFDWDEEKAQSNLKKFVVGHSYFSKRKNPFDQRQKGDQSREKEL